LISISSSIICSKVNLNFLDFEIFNNQDLVELWKDAWWHGAGVQWKQAAASQRRFPYLSPFTWLGLEEQAEGFLIVVTMIINLLLCLVFDEKTWLVLIISFSLEVARYPSFVQQTQ
jgi:hypothetical protein